MSMTTPLYLTPEKTAQKTYTPGELIKELYIDDKPSVVLIISAIQKIAVGIDTPKDILRAKLALEILDVIVRNAMNERFDATRFRTTYSTLFRRVNINNIADGEVRAKFEEIFNLLTPQSIVEERSVEDEG